MHKCKSRSVWTCLPATIEVFRQPLQKRIGFPGEEKDRQEIDQT
jgi:hypothetical protein